MITERKKRSKAAPVPDADFWKLRLYIAGHTSKSLTAFANLKRICEERLQGRYSIEIIDLIEHPSLAKEDQILAIPTVVRKLPAPIRKIIGDLSNAERVLVAIDLLREPNLAAAAAAAAAAPPALP